MILETLLDGLLLALCGLSLLGRSRHKMLDWLLPLVYTAVCLLSITIRLVGIPGSQPGVLSVSRQSYNKRSNWLATPFLGNKVRI